MLRVDDDDDLDEEDIPGFSHPELTPNSGVYDKGKGRAAEQLGTPTGGPAPRTPLSGNIGTPTGAPKATRTTVGGVRVETRYAAPIGVLTSCHLNQSNEDIQAQIH